MTGRSERIRTSDPCLPKAVLYQAELHSVVIDYKKTRPPRKYPAKALPRDYATESNLQAASETNPAHPEASSQLWPHAHPGNGQY